MLGYLHDNPRVRTVIVCGTDGAGHRAGHSLLMLHRYGVDHNGDSDGSSAANRISRSRSPEPYITASPDQVGHFRRDTSIVDMTGNSDRTEILGCIERYCA